MFAVKENDKKYIKNEGQVFSILEEIVGLQTGFYLETANAQFGSLC